MSWPDLLATGFAVVSADWGRCHLRDEGDDVDTNQVWTDCLLVWFSSDGCCDSSAKVAKRQELLGGTESRHRCTGDELNVAAVGVFVMVIDHVGSSCWRCCPRRQLLRVTLCRCGDVVMMWLVASLYHHEDCVWACPRVSLWKILGIVCPNH